jgi:predicted glycogen debranching enzyme
MAALPNMHGRFVVLNHLSELIRLPDGTTVVLGGFDQAEGEPDLPGAEHVEEFRLEMGLPVWRYRVNGFVLEKQVVLPHRQNTVHVHYQLLEGEGVLRLELKLAVHFRSADARVQSELEGPYVLTAIENCYELTHSTAVAGESAAATMPSLRLWLHGERSAFTVEGKRLEGIRYHLEQSRGYDSVGSLWTPGYFRASLSREQPVALVASCESWETLRILTPAEALAAEQQRRQSLLEQAPPAVQSGLGAELVLAADQMIIVPRGRPEEMARVRAIGDEARTVIAGYHWFTDWGRDTMISLEGLTLTTGRQAEAGCILRTFGRYVKDGLIPNLFPERETTGQYNTADATLWLFQALHRYVEVSGDRETLRQLLPTLLDIVQHHLAGTHFHIGVDPLDGLLRQGQEGYALTWMDAKVGDWVVTPRRGKAVEINALWYNALCLLAGWARDEADAAQPPPHPRARLPAGKEAAAVLDEHARRALESFNRRFWFAEGGYLYDVVDGEQGDDRSCRPNQVLAISLPHAILARERWQSVLAVVREKLLTPLGLRSLSRDHPDYKSLYAGDIRGRDAAYHQGTVWPWLIGPFIDAWLRTYPDDIETARHFLDRFDRHLGEGCVGSISEIADAEPPFTPRGCVAQAWSVAEVLRVWEKLAGAGPGK